MVAGDTQTVVIGTAAGDNLQYLLPQSTLARSAGAFLPDGVPCGPAGCSYRANFTFSGFPDSAVIQSAEDIRYVRLNMEHSSIGDLYINLTCPEGLKADILKKNSNGSATSVCLSSIGSSHFGWNHDVYDVVSAYQFQYPYRRTFLGGARTSSDYGTNPCDATNGHNQPGVGWNYCWSNNTMEGYQYAPGTNSLMYDTANAHLHYSITNRAIDSSDVWNGQHFYHPDESFSNLAGCSVNGLWYIEVMDGIISDNGYIFEAELSLAEHISDTHYAHITDNELNGPWVTRTGDSTFIITPPEDLANDTTLAYTFTMTDDNGCSFDTVIYITVCAHKYVTISDIACNSYTWYDTIYTESGDYTQTFTAANGCDSVVTLHLSLVNCGPVIDDKSCPAAPTVTDIDGNVYGTVQIGDQCWMRENLRTTHYADGTIVPVGGSDTSVVYPYYYDNSSSALPLQARGYFYNWPAATYGTENPCGVQGVCPQGWHVPSHEEWVELANFVSQQPQYTCGGETDNIGKALASNTGWFTTTNYCAIGNDQSANNATGFSAVPSGFCWSSSFLEEGMGAHFWTSAEEDYDQEFAKSRILCFDYTTYQQSGLIWGSAAKDFGLSVRCLRDSADCSTAQTQPVVTTEEATNITATSATLHGTVSNPDNVTITAHGFQWKTSQGGTYSTVDVLNATMSYNLTGLSASTSYTYRAFVTTEEGTSYGEEVSFTTVDSVPVADAAITAMATPVMGECPQSAYNISITIANMGLQTLNFAMNPAVVTIISDSLNLIHQSTISSGCVNVMENISHVVVTNVEIPVNHQIDMTFIIRTVGDENFSNDTLRMEFTLEVAKPDYDETFSNGPKKTWTIQQTSTGSLIGNWTFQEGDGVNPTIAPVYGTGRLFFNAKDFPSGTSSRAIMPVIDLSDAINPVLEIWFAQDNSSSNKWQEGVTVKISTDGCNTFTDLVPQGASTSLLRRYSPIATTPIWHLYTYDLSDFVSSGCVHIAFDAYGMAGKNINIDRVHLRNLYDNDIAVKNIYSMGETPAQYNLDGVVKARVRNEGRLTQNNVKVYLNVVGAVEQYHDSLTIPIIAPGEEKIVIFPQHHYNVLEVKDVEVCSRNDHDNSNNSAHWRMEVTNNIANYSDTSAVELLTGDYNNVIRPCVRYRTTDELVVTAVRYYYDQTYIADPEEGFRAFVANAAGDIVATSEIINFNQLQQGAWNIIPIVNSDLTNIYDFYVGIEMMAHGDYLCSQKETPLRDSTFYYLSNGTYVPQSFGRFMIGAVFDTPHWVDLGIFSMLNPTTRCDLGLEHITVEIGNNTTTDIPPGTEFHYSVNGHPAVSQTLTDTLHGHQTTSFVFNTPFDFTNNQFNVDENYNIKVWVTKVAFDRLIFNDTLSQTIQSMGKSATPVLAQDTMLVNYSTTGLLTASLPASLTQGVLGWFTRDSHGNWVLKRYGNSYTTPPTFFDTVYYVNANPGQINETIVGDDTLTGTQPFLFTSGYSRGKILYRSDEIGHRGTITQIGLYVNTAANGTDGIPIKIYMKKTTDVMLPTADTQVDWAAETSSATLVMDRRIQFSPTGWYYIDLDVPFEFDLGNLLVYTETNCADFCTGTGTMCNTCAQTVSGGNILPVFRQTNTGYGYVLYKSGNTTASLTGNYTVYPRRLNMLFNIAELHCASEKVPVYVHVPDIPKYDVQTMSMDYPTTSCALYDEHIQVTIKNTLNVPIPAGEVNVHAVINGSTILTETINEIILPEEVKTVTFSQTYDFSAPHNNITFDYVIYTTMNNEQIVYTLNDTISGQFTSIYTAGLQESYTYECNYTQTMQILQPADRLPDDVLTYYFFDSDGTLIHTTTTSVPYYTTPVLYDSAVFWIAAKTKTSNCMTRRVPVYINVKPPTYVIDDKSCPAAPTVTDIDGNVYGTVQIGDQCWMRENMRVTKYADGTPIPRGTTGSIISAYRYYPNYDSANVAAYGYLYNWYAVMRNAGSSELIPSGVQGVCPDGWHVPSDAEWIQLLNYVGSQEIYGCHNNSGNTAKAMASTMGWNLSSVECAAGYNPSSNNTTAFSMVPAGCFRIGYGSRFGEAAYVWSVTESSNDAMFGSYLDFNDTAMRRVTNLFKDAGLSVRCLRDSLTCMDTLPPVFHGTLPDGHVCPIDGSYYVPDFTTYFTEETVSDNSYPFSSLTVAQNPVAGTEINSDTEVTVTLTDPCGNERLYQVDVVPLYWSGVMIDSVVCESGLPVFWNGKTLEETGTYYDTLTNSVGCDSIVIFHLVVNHSNISYYSVISCDSYVWNGVTFTESGVYPLHLTNSSGCDSVVILYLTINSSDSTEISITTCNSYNWNGITYYESGTHVQYFNNENYCDSIVTLHLTVHHADTTEFVQMCCYQYSWNGLTYTETGDYSQILSNQDGCDSLVIMHLTVIDTVIHHITAETCGDYVWNNSLYTTTGNYTQTFLAANGCDSVVTLHLTVHHSADSVLEVTVVENDLPYYFNGHPYTETGSYTDTLLTVYGCDSILTLHLTVLHNVSVACDSAVCESELPIVWNGVTFTEAGTQTLTLTNAAGCDSVVVMTLTVNPVPTVSVTAFDTILCEGGSAILHAEAYAVNNNLTYQWYKDNVLIEGATTPDYFSYESARDSAYYYAVVVSTDMGCTVTAQAPAIAFVPDPYITVTASNYVSCVGGSATLTVDVACDVTDANFTCYWYSSNNPNTLISSSELIGTSAELTIPDNEPVDNYGYWVIVAADAYGCRSTSNIVNYAVIADPVVTITVANGYPQTVCSGGGSVIKANVTGGYGEVSYQWYMNGNLLVGETNQTLALNNLVGDMNDVYSVEVAQSGVGCSTTASVVLNTLITLESFENSISSTVCDSYTWNNTTYYESGIYTQQFQTVTGCDSIVTLHLTVNHAEATDLYATACDSYEWNGDTYTASGDYPLYLTNALGCDSVVTLHLTINHSDTIEYSAAACNNYNWNGVTYTASGDYTTYMTNAAGCNLVVVLHLTINHSDTTELYVTACDAYTWNGATYTVSGNYQHHYVNAAGCDSTVTLHLTVNHPDVVDLYETACDSYTWNGVTYTGSGDYTNYLTNADGCDSTVTLHLTVNNSIATELHATACDSYTWNGMTYTESGLYSLNLLTATGCDSLVTLHLTVHYSDTVDYYATACNSYNWNGETYTESGDYAYYSTMATGCTLVTILHLTIYDTETTEFSVTTTDSCYIWNDITYCNSGDYVQLLQTLNGCDSIVTLHLTITVGIDDYETIGAMMLYPNPTDNIVNVRFSLNGRPVTSDAEIQIFDMYGKFLHTVPVTGEKTALDLSSYASGVYMVKAVMDGQVVAVRKAVRR